jgi:AI2M/AI1M-like, HNH endonuclease/Type II intron maturase
MPQQIVRKVRSRFSSKGKIIHRPELLPETDYTILQRYQSALRGIYNYYCMAVNVSKRTRMFMAKWILETSLTKTLAHKHKCRVTSIYSKYQVTILDRKVLRVIIQRPGKEPLVAVFGGIPLERVPNGMGATEFNLSQAWSFAVSKRSEVVQRLLAGKCELCGAERPVQMHHIRKLADINRPGRPPKAEWEKIMAARKRKTLAVCEECHGRIHSGEYDGPSLRGSLESRMR